MEVLQFVPQFGKTLWDLKTMHGQHVDNGKEIEELHSFIQAYDQHIPALRERFKEGGDNILGVAMLKHLEAEIMEATNKLEKWSRNKSFFRVFNSAERMQKIQKLHTKVMASVQRSLGIASLSMLLDLQATQATVLKSNAELKSLLITSIGSTHGTLPPEVRDEKVEASTSSFADPKFWQDSLAAVSNHREARNLYEDPITAKLMIDPVVASDCYTYCRWTIIDNNLAKDPYNSNEHLRIVIDNLTIRRGLFKKFPGQFQKFQQRRSEYRSNALSLASTELLGDAVLALQYVLQWDDTDKKCVATLNQVQGALKEAKAHYIQSSLVLSDELKYDKPVEHWRPQHASPVREMQETVEHWPPQHASPVCGIEEVVEHWRPQHASPVCEMQEAVEHWRPQHASPVCEMQEAVEHWHPQHASPVCGIEEAVEHWRPQHASPLCEIEEAVEHWHPQHASPVCGIEEAVEHWRPQHASPLCEIEEAVEHWPPQHASPVYGIEEVVEHWHPQHASPLCEIEEAAEHWHPQQASPVCKIEEAVEHWHPEHASPVCKIEEAVEHWRPQHASPVREMQEAVEHWHPQQASPVCKIEDADEHWHPEHASPVCGMQEAVEHWHPQHASPVCKIEEAVEHWRPQRALVSKAGTTCT